ncbi:MAG TPA: hypothetical protein VGS79_08670 [Puia sp.]|nr:hypothetical protein [Puia sp.]
MRDAIIIMIALTLAATNAWSQHLAPQGPTDSVPVKYVPVANKPQDTDGRVLMFPVRAQCKSSRIVWFQARRVLPPLRSPRKSKDLPQRTPLITVHGNINYDFDYWSSIDTPYAEKNINQQTLQTWLDLNYRDQYPFRVIFTTRWSNSSLFRNITDVSFQYNAGQFNNKVKRQALNLLLQHYALTDSLNRLGKELNGSQKEFYALNTWLNGPEQQQRLIAQRELAWLKARDTLSDPRAPATGFQLSDWDPSHDFGMARHGSGAGPDPIKSAIPAMDSSWVHRYDSLQKHLDSLQGRIDSLQQQYQRLEGMQKKGTGDISHELDGVTSGKVLKDELDSEHVPDSSLPKGYKNLYSVRSFGIGRSLINYSELSARNVSIDGVQIEYNPKAYMAVAAGTVDYRYRDYSINDGVKGQYLALVRYGWGKKDGNSLIFTYYTGKRQLYNASTTTQGTDIPNYSLMGFTIQGCYKVLKNTSVIAEVAKSSLPYYSLDSTRSHDLLGSALKMNLRSNEAYSLKVNSLIPASQTQITATYSRFGANFQSFSLFTTGTQQSQWAVRLDQPLLQKRLLIMASVKTNDFVNPLLSTAYSSTAVFGSLQATLRLKKWPVLSFGYFPSTQIMRLTNDQYQENLFYTMTATASESYKVNKINFLSLLMYTRFYNKITDTDFVYFNTSNLLLSQMAVIQKLTLQLQLSLAANASYDLYTADGKADYRLFKWLSIGGGLKYNDQTVYTIKQWGYSATAGIIFRQLGQVRLIWDKGFIPGSNKELVPYNLGRITYTKTF